MHDDNNARLLCVRVTMVTLKSCNLIGRSRILEHVREVTRPFFSRRLKGVACETSSNDVRVQIHFMLNDYIYVRVYTITV